MKVLVLRCDGLQKNRNVPQKVKNLLKKKYMYDSIVSNECYIEYNINEFALLVNLSSFICHLCTVYKSFMYHIYIIH